MCLVSSARYSRDLMRQQPTLMCVCYHSTTYPCSVIRINRGSSFYRLRFPPPPCLYFASLQTDSENRSLVRRRMRDGRSRQGRDLCKNRHAILITAIHAMKCQTCTVTTPRRGPWLLISPLFVLIIQTGVWSIIYHVCKTSCSSWELYVWEVGSENIWYLKCS